MFREDRYSGVAAADKVNDLETIAVTKDGVLPFIARDNFEIEFDSHPVRLTAHLNYESGKSKAVRKVFGFTVNLESHETSLARDSGADEASSLIAPQISFS